MLLRWLLTATLVAGGATAIIAPAAEMAAQRSSAANQRSEATPSPDPTPSFEDLLIACLDSGNPDGAACARAQAVSGFPADEFRARIVELLGTDPAPAPTVAPTATPAPEPAKTPAPAVTTVVKAPVKAPAKTPAAEDFWTVFDKCLGTRDVTGDLCRRAQELIGFGDEEFRAKFDRYLAQKDAAGFETYFSKCLATRDLQSDKCRIAFQLSRLSEADFAAKFEAKLDGDFWSWFDRCLDTRDVQSDACARAQVLIGFSDADFRAKFERYLAERDAAAQTDKYAKWLEACVLTRDLNSDACARARQLSGLSEEAFRDKVVAKINAG